VGDLSPQRAQEGQEIRLATRAIIWDHDGIQVDTEDIWFRGSQYVGSLFDREVTEVHRRELQRSHLSEYLIERFDLDSTYEEVHELLYGKVDELAASLPLMAGVREATELCDRAGFVQGVGTGSDTAQVRERLTRLGLIGFFEAVVGQDRAGKNRPKPYPDIFLQTASELKVRPEDCLVIDDNPNGVAAARAANMACVAVPSSHVPKAEYDQADATIPSLEYFSLELIAHIDSSRNS